MKGPLPYTPDIEPVKYVCRSCGAKDSDSGRYPPIPIVLNCHKCHAGYGIPTTEQMIMQGKGMFREAQAKAN